MSTLLAAGGALDLRDPPANEILRTFVAQAGGGEARIVIVTIASAAPHETADAYTAALCALGVSHITPFDLTQRQEADQADERVLLEATGIYLSGGNQLRLTTLINGTAVGNALRAAYQRGVILFGSSAGTAVMPHLMLAHGEAGQTPRQGMAHLAAGLGLRDDLIFDQHFSQRGRLGRLLTAVANNPHLLGVGVDENTAVLVSENSLRVLGQQGVTLIDGRQGWSNAADQDADSLLSLSGFRLHHLVAGDCFDLTRRTAAPPTGRRVFA